MPNTIDISKLCMGCMSKLDNTDEPCPKCGFDIQKNIPSAHQLKPCTILNGKYLVGKVLGEGGFGITYLGWDLNLDIKIAIKEYYPTGLVTRETTSIGSSTVTPFSGGKREFYNNGLDKFVNEAKSLAKFYTLPGIVAVKDFFRENGTAYIVMEYVDGITLKQHLGNSEGKLRPNEVFELMRPLMKSLSQIHAEGIIHRDISPDNIMLTNKGDVKLLDFGAARDFISDGNKSLSVLLKPGYAPEEQYRTKGNQGPWTDVYALCATIYKMLTGITPPESLERFSEDELITPSKLGIQLSSQTENALLKGLAVFQRDRYQGIAELYNDVYGDTQWVKQETPYNPVQLEQEISRNKASATIEQAVNTISQQNTKPASEAVLVKEKKTSKRTIELFACIAVQIIAILVTFSFIHFGTSVGDFSTMVLVANMLLIGALLLRKEKATIIERMLHVVIQSGFILYLTYMLGDSYYYYKYTCRYFDLSKTVNYVIYFSSLIVLVLNIAYTIFDMVRYSREHQTNSSKGKKRNSIAVLAGCSVFVLTVIISFISTNANIKEADAWREQVLKEKAQSSSSTQNSDSTSSSVSANAPKYLVESSPGEYMGEDISFSYPTDWALSTNSEGFPLITGIQDGIQYQLSILDITEDTTSDIYDYTLSKLSVTPLDGGMGSVGNTTIGGYSGVLTGCLFDNNGTTGSLTLYCLTDGVKRVVIETRFAEDGNSSNYDEVYQNIIKTLIIY